MSKKLLSKINKQKILIIPNFWPVCVCVILGSPFLQLFSRVTKRLPSVYKCLERASSVYIFNIFNLQMNHASAT